MNIAAIGSAISDLFAALTPPSGYLALQKVSNVRQATLGKLPAVVVEWVDTRDIVIGFGERTAVVEYSAKLFLPKVSDEKDDEAQQAWHDVVIDALLLGVLLNEVGNANGIKDAQVQSVTPGEEQLGEPYYAALDVSIAVEVWHPVTVSA